MSYICMLANRRGIAAAGDSRLTFSHRPLHLDRSQKVFADPAQHLIWACCGLTVWGGVNYIQLTSRILGRRQWSLSKRLALVCRRVAPALRVQHRIQRQDALFTLLVGVAEPGNVQLMSLDLVNGEASLGRWPAPAMTEAGWKRALRPPMPDPNGFREEPLELLARRARARVQWAVARDRELHGKNPAHRQTVGGQVKWAVWGIPEEL